MPYVRSYRLLMLTVVLALLSGCTPVSGGVTTVQPRVSPIAPQMTNPAPASPLGTPTPSDTLPPTAPNSPLAAPTTGASQPAATNTPHTAVVQGIVRRPDGTPIKRISVWAATVDRRDNLPMASVDMLTDPRSSTDENGKFVFQGLAPGEYAFVMQSPSGPVLVQTLDAKTIICDCKADQFTDLGDKIIHYEFPDGQE